MLRALTYLRNLFYKVFKNQKNIRTLKLTLNEKLYHLTEI